MRRRSPRSAISPPNGVKSQAGAARTNASKPITNEDAPRLRRSHGSATCCVHVPIFDRKLANQNVLKRLVSNNAKESWKQSCAQPVTIQISAGKVSCRQRRRAMRNGHILDLLGRAPEAVCTNSSSPSRSASTSRSTQYAARLARAAALTPNELTSG